MCGNIEENGEGKRHYGVDGEGWVGMLGGDRDGEMGRPSAILASLT
jgi:hypothetical protein